MKVIDVQAQMTTRKGALFPDKKDFFETSFKTKIPYFQTEEEMMGYYRSVDASVILVTPAGNKTDMGELRDVNDYVGQLKKDYPDVVAGFWVGFHPDLGIHQCLKELERCIKDLGAVGYYHMADLGAGIPANDPRNYPLYGLCQEAGAVIKTSIGHTAAGAGLPGGGGVRLKHERPIPVLDDIAVDFPDLSIIGAHCPWPFQNEMISVMLHKANVYCDLHGWSPKYFPPEIKKEVNGRLKHKFFFGSDYPFLYFDRLYEDWESEGYRPEALENVYYKNAQKVFKL
ncbi:MAG: amidohydrolase family protein [Desulfatiglans sp.]|nr:amidohydrolase family protein [Thermodesulfobacteriota bacterium]MEE4354318.1 amidohydrolase family protein [Desulfatiglans sp.]